MADTTSQVFVNGLLALSSNGNIHTLTYYISLRALLSVLPEKKS